MSSAAKTWNASPAKLLKATPLANCPLVLRERKNSHAAALVRALLNSHAHSRSCAALARARRRRGYSGFYLPREESFRASHNLEGRSLRRASDAASRLGCASSS